MARNSLYKESVERISCPNIRIDHVAAKKPLVTVDSSASIRNFNGQPIIQLSVRKPREWSWKLTTSASSPSIVIPLIRLIDEKGGLLIETGSRTGVSFKETKSDSRARYSPSDIKSNTSKWKPETKEQSRKPGLKKRKTFSFDMILCENDLDKSLQKSSKDKKFSKKVGRSKRNKLRDAACSAAPDIFCFDEDSPSLLRPILPKRNLTHVRRPPSMGSNVSRHSGKGLSGRRSQSSGNLYQGSKLKAATNNSGAHTVRRENNLGSPRECPGLDESYKLSGSLPNYLDAERPDVVLTGHRRFKYEHTWGHDQGYASERSPEDDHMPAFLNTAESPTPALWKARLDHLVRNYPFITPATTFEVRLVKGYRGFGFSVCGGLETKEPWAGLVRIKRLFPHQPAWQTGLLAHADILLAANDQPLVGLTNVQALQVLRQMPVNVILTVCRAPEHIGAVNQRDVTVLPPPPPPRRTPPTRILRPPPPNRPLPPTPPPPTGEVSIILRKINHSLGFTLRKEDGSALGHYIRALVKEPAISDGRIFPGDKIVQVNGVDISPLSHEQAVAYLRKCGDIVHLKLYRDGTQTPVSTSSPTEESDLDFPLRPRAVLRKEAVAMLSELATRKQSPSEASGSERHLRIRRPQEVLTSPSSENSCQYIVESANSESGFELQSNAEEMEFQSLKPERPSFLDLGAQSGAESTNSQTRKQRFALYLPSQLENVSSTTTTSDDENCIFVVVLDNPSANSQEDLSDAMAIYNENEEDPDCRDVVQEATANEPTSLPPMTNLSSTSSTSTAFSYRNPAYQSAHPACAPSLDSNSSANDDGSKGLLKWKGTVLPDAPASSPASTTDLHRTITYDQYKIFVVELCKGWNSRLGFSLKQDCQFTYISAIYPDSVASKDGRLQVGDRVIKVNDEDVQTMSTADIIDLLRKIRGVIAIKIMRCGSTIAM